MRSAEIGCRINGAAIASTVEVSTSLADWIREDLNLTGTHLGCEHGVCGSCTVLVDGAPVRSCLMLAVHAHGADIQTIEGVALRPGELHPLQRCLVESASFQCGFCASGFVMSILGLSADLPDDPEDDDIRDLISGNLCRCTGYGSIVAGVRAYLASHPGSQGVVNQL
jgi:carbon-monoxide dehydrogenase small subunit